MSDVTSKGKRIFWIMILTVFAFAAVPSLVLLEKAKEYYSFLTAWEPKPLKPQPARAAPHPPQQISNASSDMPDIHFVEFRLSRSEAKSVYLSASFNGWKPDSLALTRDTGDYWKILVPLPPGTYQYLYEVDGRSITDPSAASSTLPSGRIVSLKKVP